MDVEMNESQLAVTQDFVSTVEDLQRLIKLNCSVTPSTFLRAIDVDADDVEESDKGLNQFSGLSDDSGYGHEIGADEDLPCSFSFTQMDIGPHVPKTPTKTAMDTLGQTLKTPTSLFLLSSPGHEFKTPKSTDLSEEAQKLSTPERLALEMTMQASSPVSLPAAVSAKPKPLFRKCFSGRPMTRNQLPNEPRPMALETKPKFRLSSPVFNYKTKQLLVSESALKRSGREKENPAPVTHKQQQVLEQYYQSKRRVSAQKKTIKKLSAQLVYAKLDGCDEGLKKDNGTVISDIVVQMLSSENFMASRPQVIVQDPGTQLEMQHFKQQVRAQKRNCDCPCYCDNSQDGPSERKRYFTSTLPPLN